MKTKLELIASRTHGLNEATKVCYMKLKTLIQSLCVIGAAATITTGANAVPIQWKIADGGNDHYYEYIESNESWTDSRAAALGMTHLGESGYLATATSAAENNFLTFMVSGAIGWLGGTDMATEGTWMWADGPEAGDVFWTGGPGGSTTTFANWHAGEPNNDSNEDFLHTNFFAADGLWNDLTDASDTSPNDGYFVEYNPSIDITPVPDPIPVPEPGTLALFGIGLAGLGFARRRKTA